VGHPVVLSRALLNPLHNTFVNGPCWAPRPVNTAQYSVHTTRHGGPRWRVMRACVLNVADVTRLNCCVVGPGTRQDFGGNVDKHLERVHYLNSPFVARYIRFHPVDWHRHISMRAGVIGCPHRGLLWDFTQPQR